MDRALYYVAVYALSIFGGWLLVGACMYGMRLTIQVPRKFFQLIDLWVGGTERLVATTLVLFAPQYVPAFIGGWIALKFAANWKRLEPNDQPARQASLLFLVGNALSFAIAIGAVLLIRPDALAVWDRP